VSLASHWTPSKRAVLLIHTPSLPEAAHCIPTMGHVNSTTHPCILHNTSMYTPQHIHVYSTTHPCILPSQTMQVSQVLRYSEPLWHAASHQAVHSGFLWHLPLQHLAYIAAAYAAASHPCSPSFLADLLRASGKGSARSMGTRCEYVGLARTIHKYCVCTVILAGKCPNIRHYTVYTWSWPTL